MKIIDIQDIRNRFKSSIIITDLSFVKINNDKKIYELSDILIFLSQNILMVIMIHWEAKLLLKSKIFFNIWNYRSTFGGIIDPFAAYLTVRSLKTYSLRFSKMMSNTKKVLEYLSSCSEVKNIWYPGEHKNKNQYQDSKIFY